MIAYALTGSFCTHRASLKALDGLIAAGEDVLPILSENVRSTDTRFGKASATALYLENVTGKKPIATVRDAEPLGPSVSAEVLIIAPCTGNSLAKLASGISDTSVTMAAKAQLRADRPVLIALASNDAMSANLGSIATLLNRKNVYFVPMVQDDPVKKPHSLVADFSLIPDALAALRRGENLRPLFR